MTFTEQVGAQLRQVRKGKGWGVEKAADRAGVSATTLWRWERGVGIPLQGFLWWCRALGANPAHILSGVLRARYRARMKARRDEPTRPAEDAEG